MPVNHLHVNPGGPLRGCTSVPGDKSISHRALMLGALAEGTSEVHNFLPSGDCGATLGCIRALGITVDVHTPTALSIHGRGLHGLRAPTAPLDCVRSGTTMRLLAGILAGQAFESTLSGAPQLLRRPMRRITVPLRQMNADIEDTDGHAPLVIRGHRLHGSEHSLNVASAQVKSALLLAGLYAEGSTIVHQPGPARDHTERMLHAMSCTHGAAMSGGHNAAIDIDGLSVTLRPPAALRPLDMTIPGDLSSAAFPLVAALLVPDSGITIAGAGTNPTRTGLLDVLWAMGAKLSLANPGEQGGEPVADITAEASTLHGTDIGGDTVVRMIDEFPILAVAATQAHGTTRVQDARELRVKETDRIATVVNALQALGASIEARPDGFVVEGPTPLSGGVVDSHHDHRLAMAIAVAGLLAEGPVVVENADCIADSFPGFVALMRRLGASYA